MNINCLSCLSFSGVIPVNVYKNDLREYDESFVRSACRKATNLIAGPIEPKYYDLAKQLEEYDDSYSFNDAVRGYCRKWRNFETGEIKSEVPSDYFKIVFNGRGDSFIITGKDALNLGTLGKALGIEKKRCRDAHIKSSKELLELKKYYNGAVNSLLHDRTKRLKENMHLGISIKTNGKNSKLDEIFLIQG